MLEGIKQSKTILDTQDSMKLGVLGFGGHCKRSHLANLGQSLDDVQLAIYDPSPGALNAIEPEHKNLVRYQTEKELLLSPVEAVFIMSPDHCHADTLLHAVRAGKHVLVEKPLAATSAQLETVKQALRTAEEKGIIVTSCHPRRFDPPYQWIKNNLDKLTDQLGALLHFQFDFSYHTPSNPWKDERGLILDHANHEIDLVNWYLGHESFSAYRISDTSRRCQISGVRADGVAFTFFGTRALNEHVFQEFVKLRFERGELTLDASSGVVQITNHEDSSSKHLKIRSIDYKGRFEKLNQNFLKAIKGEEDNYLTTEDLYVNTALSVFLTERERWDYHKNK